VAFVKDGKRLLAPGPDAPDEPLVGGKLEQVAGTRVSVVGRERNLASCRFHDFIIGPPTVGMNRSAAKSAA
jgi:hypothetical protein